MDREARDVMSDNKQADAQPGASVELDQFNSVHRHLHERLCEEVENLEQRVRGLRDSSSMHSPTIIRTYERMIRKKLDFMQRWGMDTSCGRR